MLQESTYRNVLLALIRQARPSIASVTNLLAPDALGTWITAWEASRSLTAREFDHIDHLVGRVVNGEVNLVYARSRENWEKLTSLNALSVPNQDRVHVRFDVHELKQIDFPKWVNSPSRSYSIHGGIRDITQNINYVSRFLGVVNSHVLIEVREH